MKIADNDFINPAYKTGQDLTFFLTTNLNVKPAQLAALLNITPSTLQNISNQPLESDDVKLQRLKKLYYIVDLLLTYWLPNDLLINALNDVIPEDAEQRSLLWYVCNDRSDWSEMEKATKLIADCFTR